MFEVRCDQFDIVRCDPFNIVNVSKCKCQNKFIICNSSSSGCHINRTQAWSQDKPTQTSRWKIDNRPSSGQPVYWPYCKCQLRRTLKRTISLMWNSPLLERGQHAIRVWCQMIGWAGSLTVEPDPGTPRPRKKCWRIVYICLQFPPSLNLWMPSRI